jgi:hypothetical protein
LDRTLCVAVNEDQNFSRLEHLFETCTKAASVPSEFSLLTDVEELQVREGQFHVLVRSHLGCKSAQMRRSSTRRPRLSLSLSLSLSTAYAIRCAADFARLHGGGWLQNLARLTSLSQFVRFYGAKIFTIWRAALIGLRILYYSSVPVMSTHFHTAHTLHASTRICFARSWLF